MHGQWSHPVVRGRPGAAGDLHGQGDGWLRGFDPATGKLLWKFDGNPKDAMYELGGTGTKSDFIGDAGGPRRPRLHRHRPGPRAQHRHRATSGASTSRRPSNAARRHRPRRLAGTGRAGREAGDGDGEGRSRSRTRRRRWCGCTAARRRGSGLRATSSSAARCAPSRVVDDVVYVAELHGYLHCLNAKTGRALLAVRHEGVDLGFAVLRGREGAARHRQRRPVRLQAREEAEEVRRRGGREGRPGPEGRPADPRRPSRPRWRRSTCSRSSSSRADPQPRRPSPTACCTSRPRTRSTR